MSLSQIKEPCAAVVCEYEGGASRRSSAVHVSVSKLLRVVRSLRLFSRRVRGGSLIDTGGCGRSSVWSARCATED